MKEAAIKVGVIADQTGPLSFAGIANANVAKLVIDDINAKGGLLGRRVDLYLEDSATIDSVAEAKATKLVEHDKVDVIFGGIYSSTREAIKGPAVVKGKNHSQPRRTNMMLATTKVEDFDQFMKIFSSKGAEKRIQYGSKGATLFRDPAESDRVWVLFDWEERGFKSFAADPEVAAIMKEAGHIGRPQVAPFSSKVNG